MCHGDGHLHPHKMLHIPYTSLKLSFKIDLYLQYVSTKTAIIRLVI